MKYQTATKTQLWNLVKNLQKQIEDNTGKIRNLKYNRDRLLDQNSNLKEKNKELQEKVEELEETVVTVTNQNEELRGRFGALVHEHSTEVTECTKLLQQLKEHNQILNIEIDKKNKELKDSKAAFNTLQRAKLMELEEAKEEAAYFRQYEAAAQKKEEEHQEQYKQVQTHYHNAAGRMEEAKDYLWSMYDDLLQNKEIEKSDLKFVIGLMYY